jgi:hypothetical protein
MERTCWESVGSLSGPAVERLCRLMREGRVRRVEIQENRRTVAEFPVDGEANELIFASVLDAARAAGQTCTIRAELTDVEAAHAAGLQTTIP